MSRALAIFWIALLCEGLLMSLAARPEESVKQETDIRESDDPEGDLTKRWFWGSGCSGSRPAGHSWSNEWDKPMLFECPKSQSISSIYSIYRACRKDRLYEFKCTNYPNVGDSKDENCYWTTDYENNYDEPIAFVCPCKMYLAGVDSIHRDHEEDRRFKFKCCERRSFGSCRSKGCYKTSYVNSYKGVLDYKVPRNYYLVGAHSVHDNSQEDRRWQFEVCKIPPKRKQKGY